MKPNIILVMTDQQRGDLRKSQGFPLDTMPFLDLWAKGGTDFQCAYTSNPICIPARVSLFTGRYPSSTHVRTNCNTDDAFYSADLLDIMKDLGYTTALCGKNHTYHSPNDFDFHETNDHSGTVDLPCNSDTEQKFDAFLRSLRCRYSDVPSPYGIESQLPYRNVNSALKFIDSVERNQPFFLWLSFAEPHPPYQVPAPYFDMFPIESLPAIQTKAVYKDERHTWLYNQWKEVYGDEIDVITARSRSNYYGMLRLIDDQFKRFIMGLEERKLCDHTIIIYMSDHGDYAGEYGLMRKGVDLSESLVHIPMIWKIPNGLAKGSCSDVMVNCVDVLPTLCDLLQYPVPIGVQGKSLLPILKGGVFDSTNYEVAYAEAGYGGDYWNKSDLITPQMDGCMDGEKSFICLNRWTGSGQCRMLRKGNFKIQMDMRGNNYLYNLQEDPFEIENLWTIPQYNGIKYELMQLLIQYMLRYQDVLPVPRDIPRAKLCIKPL